MSFESKDNTFDIYKPHFSSDEGSKNGADLTLDDEDDERMFASEEAKGKICDERLSELNPCISDDSNTSNSSQCSIDNGEVNDEDDDDDEDDTVRTDSSTSSQPNIRPDLLSQALNNATTNGNNATVGRKSGANVGGGSLHSGGNCSSQS